MKSVWFGGKKGKFLWRFKLKKHYCEVKAKRNLRRKLVYLIFEFLFKNKAKFGTLLIKKEISLRWSGPMIRIFFVI